MAQPYFSLVTTVGKVKFAASAAGGPAVTITHFSIGDGNGAETNPTAASTALVREVWRTGVESVVTDPLNPAAILVTAIVPTAVGGWWMREFGIFDAAGAMIAVAKPVSQYKPTALEGQLEDIRYEFQIIIGETANVTLLVDPSVLLASRAWVEGRKTPINRLAATPWLPVISRTITAPPGAPAPGDLYLVPAGATGAWAGQAGKIAEATEAGWFFISAPNGHGISLPDGKVFERVGGNYVEKVALDAQSGKWVYVAAGGTGNAITATLDPVPAAYSAGLEAHIKIATANTSAVTVNLNGLGAKSLLSKGGAALVAGDLLPGDIVVIVYDGAAFRAVSLARSEIGKLIRAQPVVYFRASQANTNLPNSVTTLVTGFDNVLSNLGDTTYLNGVFTIGSADAGRWLFWGGATAGANTRLRTAIVYNGSQSSIGDDGDTVNVVITTGNINLIELTAGATIQLQMLQSNSGGAAQVIGGFLMGIRIGA